MLKVFAILFLLPTALYANPINFDENYLRSMNYKEAVIIKKEAKASEARNDKYLNFGLCVKNTQFLSRVDLYNPLEARKLNLAKLDELVTIRGSVFTNKNQRYTAIQKVNLASGIFKTISAGDFPYSVDMEFTEPLLTDGRDITIALRGYLNIKQADSYTFGVNTDDGVLVLVGGLPIMYNDFFSPINRLTRQVTFQESGLYPIEIIYYQNMNAAYLELSSIRGTPTNPGFDFGPTTISLNSLENTNYKTWDNKPVKMELMSSNDFFNTLDGPPANFCAFCESDNECSSGSKCLDGLCQETKQVCTTGNRCGESCSACPVEMNVCSADGKCVECVSNSDCLNGNVCNSTNNKCEAPKPECVIDADCKYPYANIEYQCNTKSNKCELKNPKCEINADCKINEICGPQKKCIVYEENKSCSNNFDCSLLDYCDETTKICTRLSLGQCREQVQCYSGYTCDTTNRICVKNPDISQENDVKRVSMSGKQSCNQSDGNFSLMYYLAIAFFVVIKSTKRVLVLQCK